MKFTLSWLKEHIIVDCSLEEICCKLTSIGLEVEKVDDRSALSPFKIVKILSVDHHPASNNLKILKIDIGQQDNMQVVCGANNVKVGLLGVWASPGSCVPSTNMKINKSNIRGVESFGMMCSEKELMLSDNHIGIMELSDDAPIGGKFIDYFGLSDPIIEIALTPNRSDCAGVRGIAMDLAASGLGTLKVINTPVFITSGTIPLDIKIDLDDLDLCKGFAMCHVKGVRNGLSPDWMRKRLEAVGLRSISTLVDITNYIALDLGYPLHVFDSDKISGNIVVRRASDGEKIVALNDKIYDLSPDNVIISSDKVIESIAGIIGGKSADCDDDTVNVLIESALWNPANISRSGQSLGIITDSRYRFERGVDLQGMIPALKKAVSLIVSLCGGVPSEICIKQHEEYKPRKIEFVNSEVKRLSGIDVADKDSFHILQKLGFGIDNLNGKSIVSVPSWRHDIDNKADLVEEILRIYGVDRIKGEPFYLSPNESKGSLSLQQMRIRLSKRILAARAMMEVITWSFIPKKQSILFGGGGTELEILNPISSDMSDMRTSILPSLLAAVKRNVDRATMDLSIFEVSHVYENDRPEGQKCMAAGVRKGSSRLDGYGRFWIEKHGDKCRYVDVFDSKGDALAVIEPFVSIDSIKIEASAPSWYHPGRSGTIKIGKDIVLGYFGEFHPDVLCFFGLSGSICGFEVFIDSIPISEKRRKITKKIASISSLHPIRRDFSFLIDKSTPAGTIIDIVKKVDRKLIVSVDVFDVFEGKSLGDSKKSIAIEVLIQPLKSTLCDDDVKDLTDRIVESVIKNTKAVLRSA
ncbi:MAG: phenylalanine--tRNA ligase subunit beta [Candidatus Liberibacter europaeus]|uniref:Phenylalanine--tRNA ligase beta subunit n=1 Tax=Candidatus Liberibacter europaeus TaxID=744859 RepID=A0A2T4VXW4_9HYPH|nr:phenylalanine--tRNA ligase subunit beta [Candidatus Liberibacter europaeus]PTL86614.1 MAG: phenylalanine--tRNA ligase subunit beta [Candidatus Liberibacter europaeus]